MSRPRTPLAPCLALLLCAATPLKASTTQNFDTAGDAYILEQYDQAPAATIIGGGPSGNFLRLTNDGTFNQINAIAFDRTDKGAFCTVTIDLDFRVTASTTPADGMGVVFLDTAAHDETGAIYSLPEEPNFTGSVGVGLDIYENPGELNDNHVSLHFDGVKLLDVDATPLLNLDAGTFAHLQIEIASTTTSGNVRVDITPSGGAATTLINQSVPGLRPYEGRLQVSARTGGASADHDIDNVAVSYADCPGELGSWGSVMPWPVIAIHAELLPNGKVLFWDRDDALPAPPQLFDPATGTVTAVPDPGVDLFCSGHSFLADGRLLVTGGHDGYDEFGLPNTFFYDFTNNSWTETALMNAGRWYPTNLTLPSGDVLVIAGTVEPGVNNSLPQVFEVATESWRDLSSASKNVPLYAAMLQAPDGRAAMVMPGVATELLDTSGTGNWSTIANRVGPYRNYGTAVAYDHGELIVIGGGDPPQRSAEVIDLGHASPAWRFLPEMAYQRRHANGLLLADGTVLVSGGTSVLGFNDATGSVYTPELWDPVSETFTRLAGHQIPRLYHSFSLLLPDARVLTGGGGHPPGLGGDFDHLDAEIYSPAYLFKGPRPTITSAPPQLGYNQQIFVATPDGASIANVNFISLSATTHSFNQNQRIHRASFTTAPGGLLIDTPPTNIHAAPGYYMLFLVSDQGVPSVAQMVQVLNDFSAANIPVLPPLGLWLLASALALTTAAWSRQLKNRKQG